MTFRDNFSDPAYTAEKWEISAGIWYVEEGVLVCDRNPEPRPYDSHISPKSPLPRDFDMTFKWLAPYIGDRLRHDNSLACGNVGAWVRFQSHHNYYAVAIWNGLANLTLYRIKNGIVITLKDIPLRDVYPLGRNTWYKTRILMEGPHIAVWIDDLKLIDMIDPDPMMKAGRANLYNWKQGAYFDDFRIETLPSLPTFVLSLIVGSLLTMWGLS